MKVLIATVGTRGDVQPYLALAIGLKTAGHEVTLCTCPRFRTFVTEHGISYSHLDDGLLQLLESDLGRSVFENLNGILGVLRTILRVIKQVGPIHRRMVDDCWAATEAPNPDMIVYHPKMFCVPHFAARRNIPCVLAMLSPMHVPTGESPLFGRSMGRSYNRATYRLVHQLTKLGTRSYLRGWRAQHDKECRARSSSPTRTSPNQSIPVHQSAATGSCLKKTQTPNPGAHRRNYRTSSNPALPQSTLVLEV